MTGQARGVTVKRMCKAACFLRPSAWTQGPALASAPSCLLRRTLGSSAARVAGSVLPTQDSWVEFSAPDWALAQYQLLLDVGGGKEEIGHSCQSLLVPQVKKKLSKI